MVGCRSQLYRRFSFLQRIHTQKISEQIKLDKAILELLNDIELALDLAPDEETLRSRCRKSDRHEKTLARLLAQITECGHFIQSYVKDVNFGVFYFLSTRSDSAHAH